MKSKVLLSILMLGGSAEVCLAQAQSVAPPTPAEAPAVVTAMPAEPAAEPVPQPSQVAPVAEPAVDPNAPLIAYSGSMTTIMAAATPGKAVFAMVGAAAMIAEGSRIIAENNVIDPSQAMARDLATDLARLKSARLADGPVEVKRNGITIPKPPALAAAAPQAAYVVDVESGWSTSYFPVEWTRFHVLFTSNMRLADVATKTAAVKHFCTWDSDKDGGLKTSQADLFGDGAKGLKAALAQGATFCTGQFKAKIAETFGAAPAEPKPAVAAAS